MAGNAKSVDFFILISDPVGFVMYFVKHFIVCQMTKPKQNPLNQQDNDVNVLKKFFNLFWVKTFILQMRMKKEYYVQGSVGLFKMIQAQNGLELLN